MARPSDIDIAMMLLFFALGQAGKKRAGGAATAPAAKAPAALPERPAPRDERVWSLDLMRKFAAAMQSAGLDPRMALLAVAAASDFRPDEMLGGNTGLLLMRREDLGAVGYPGVPLFEELTAAAQIPWLEKALAYRIASAGGSAPKTVADLAVLLHPSNPTVTQIMRSEAERRSNEAKQRPLYKRQAETLALILGDR